MSPGWIGFVLGAVLGFGFAVFLVSLCLAAKRGDRIVEEDAEPVKPAAREVSLGCSCAIVRSVCRRCGGLVIEKAVREM